MINLISGIALCSIGVLLVLLCKPLAMRKVKPNRWYGIRFRESFQSEENWYRINEFGARRMIPWGLFLALIGLIPLGFALWSPGSPLVCSCLPWLPLVLLFPVLQSWMFAKSLGHADCSG